MKRGFSDIIVTFLFIIFLIISLIILVGVGLSITGLKLGFENQRSNLNEVIDAKQVIINCLEETAGNYSLINDCLGDNFIGGYIDGVTFKEVYGNKECNTEFSLGNESDNTYVYWTDVNQCLVKILINNE